MTAADTVLSKLQAAWDAAPTLPPPAVLSPLDVSPRASPAFGPLVEQTSKGPAHCSTHTNAADWIDEQDDARRGWIRSTCRRCGAFVGYRPTDLPKRR